MDRSGSRNGSGEHVKNAILPSGIRQKDTRSPLQMSSFAHIKSDGHTRARTYTHTHTHTCHTCVCRLLVPRRGPIGPWREQTRRHVCRRSATLYSPFRSKGEEEGPKRSLLSIGFHALVRIFTRTRRVTDVQKHACGCACGPALG